MLETKKVSPQTDLQFVITGLVEIESTYFMQVEKDSIDVNDLAQHMGLQAEGNATLTLLSTSLWSF